MEAAKLPAILSMTEKGPWSAAAAANHMLQSFKFKRRDLKCLMQLPEAGSAAFMNLRYINFLGVMKDEENAGTMCNKLSYN